MVVLLAAYGFVVAFLTWPLLLHATTHHVAVPSSFDWFHMTWSLAWESHALVTHPSRFAEGNVFHPTPHALFYGPIGLGALPLFAPVFLVFGNPTLATNFVFLAGLTLTAWGLHCIVRGWTGSHLAGFIAAATFLTCRFILRYLPPSAPHYAALMYFPWILWLSAKPTLRLGQAIALTLLIALQCLADTVYLAPAVAAPVAVLAAGLLLRGKTRARGMRLALALLAALLLVSPVYYAYLRVMAQNPELSRQSTWRSDLAAVPPLGDLLRSAIDRPVDPASITPVMWVLLPLGAVALLRRETATVPDGWRRALTQGFLWFAVCLPLSLHPRARWGDEIVRLPLGYLQEWFPVLERLRVAHRVAIGSLMGLAVLSGVAFAAIETWLRARIVRPRWASAIALSLAVLAGSAAYLEDEEVSGPIGVSLTPQVDPRLLAPLRAGTGPMLVLPQGARENARAMFQSVYHWRPLLNGYSSYWPDGFTERMARANRLPHPRAVAALVEETRFKLVWLNFPARLAPAEREAWDRAVKQGRFQRVAATKDVWLLRIQAPPPTPRAELQRPSAKDHH